VCFSVRKEHSGFGSRDEACLRKFFLEQLLKKQYHRYLFAPSLLMFPRTRDIKGFIKHVLKIKTEAYVPN
jgi:hypothetical protein